VYLLHVPENMRDSRNLRDSLSRKTITNGRLFYFFSNADNPFTPHFGSVNAGISYLICDGRCTTAVKDKEKPAGMLHDISLIPTVSYV
jgi:hypothetical protein